MNKTIVFTGHINLGEKITSEVMNTINKAKNENNKTLILIGDIDFENKVLNYLKKGNLEIINNYLDRLDCNNSGCVASQLPKNERDIKKIIDFDTFEFIKEHFYNNHYILYNKIKKLDDLLIKKNNVYSDFKKVIDLEVKPIIINKIIGVYNLKFPLIVYEKKLRNKVRQKLNKSRSKNWMTIVNKKENEFFINDQKIMNSKGNILCRGIIFCMYEFIAEKNYKVVKHFIEEKHYLPLYKGWILFNESQKNIKHLKNKINSVEFFIG